MADTMMDPTEFASAQAALRAAVSARLGAAVAAVEAERGTRLGGLDQEQLANRLVLRAIEEYSRSRLEQGRPVPTAQDEDRLGRAVLDGLLTASSTLQTYLDDPTVMSIRANDYATTWITYVDGRKERGPALANDHGGLIDLIKSLAEAARDVDGIEHRFDKSKPRLDCALANGDRVFALMGVCRPTFVIRRHNFVDLESLEDLQEGGMLSGVEVNLLRALVLAKFNLVVSGGMKTGKTTLTRVLINTVPAWERKVVLEDTPELGLDRFPHLHPDVLSVCPRGTNQDGEGTITMAELGEWLLRAEPDRFIVGESRGGGEIMALLTAMTCGNEGSMTTVHAPSTKAALSKLALMCARSAERLPRDQAEELIASAVDFVIHLEAVTTSRGIRRYVSSIRAVVPNTEGGGIASKEVWRRNRDGSGGPCGEFERETLRRLEEVGLDRTPWMVR